MSEDLRETQAREHREKFHSLAVRIGIARLTALVETLVPEGRSAGQYMFEMATADPHLNNIRLARWDRLAGLPFLSEMRRRHCASCTCKGHDSHTGILADPREMRFDAPWTPDVANRLSLSERVSTLKHVAIHHVAGIAE